MLATYIHNLNIFTNIILLQIVLASYTKYGADLNGSIESGAACGISST